MPPKLLLLSALLLASLARVASGLGGFGLGATSGAQNISGIYQGHWEAAPGRQPRPVLSGVRGGVALSLRGAATPRSGILSVEGELVLRDGGLAAGLRDVRLNIQGVYVAATGRLLAVADSMQPFILPGPQLGEASALGGGEEAELAEEDRQLVLQRVAAELLLLLGGDSPDLGDVPLAALAEVAARATAAKECHFSLHLTFQPGGAGGGAPRGGGVVSIPQLAGTAAEVPGTLARGRDFTGSLISANCGVAVSLNGSAAHAGAYLAKATNYTILVTAISFVQILLLVRQMEGSAGQSQAARVSLWTVGHQAVMDAYLCLLHLTVGIFVSALFNSFCTAAFFSFVLFAIFGLRWLLFSWRARRGSGAEALLASRELSSLYARFYSALLAAVVLSYYLQGYMKLALFPVFSFWLPQIMLSARLDQQQPLRPEYVVGMTLTRLALPLYIFGCPHNLLRIQPCPRLCVALAAYVALQAAVLIVQHRRGPRAFLPRSLLPPQYDYFRPVSVKSGKGVACDVETGEVGLECVICMSNVDIFCSKQRMVTPCGHFFHADCLRQWMAAAGCPTCPTCRRVLPSL